MIIFALSPEGHIVVRLSGRGDVRFLMRCVTRLVLDRDRAADRVDVAPGSGPPRRSGEVIVWTRSETMVFAENRVSCRSLSNQQPPIVFVSLADLELQGGVVDVVVLVEDGLDLPLYLFDLRHGGVVIDENVGFECDAFFIQVPDVDVVDVAGHYLIDHPG